VESNYGADSSKNNGLGCRAIRTHSPPLFLTLDFGESLTTANHPSDRYDYAECQGSAGLPIIPYPDF